MSINNENAERDFLSGKNGIVWATYNQAQLEIICNALLAQNINSETGTSTLNEKELSLIIIPKAHDVGSAIDFIWKDKSGLCLKPDWYYPAGESNKSFDRWLSENVKYK